MNLQEFKAWFEGYTENLKNPPSAKQWDRIKARVEEITEKPTEIRYFYDHYWRPYYGNYCYSNTLAGGSANAATLTATGYTQYSNGQNTASAYSLSSTDAFKMLGTTEAKSEAA